MERKWAVREFDSLIRKFCNLYGKSKPTEKGGAHTFHNGCDNGVDDALLLNELTSIVNKNIEDTHVSAKSGVEASAEGKEDEDDAASSSTHPGEADMSSDENTPEETTGDNNPRGLRNQMPPERTKTWIAGDRRDPTSSSPETSSMTSAIPHQMERPYWSSQPIARVGATTRPLLPSKEIGTVSTPELVAG
ncbi:unnamed protein product [Phytophthora fragariaefolia]|uniref:Unnamed protein product n=1 Tax=Phytophthora fragariaefolia TaxID=1490495 RepID=A0A9W6TZY9_9STRA|nr:unnamed protein product [Phytophthora fragariaefolia]